MGEIFLAKHGLAGFEKLAVIKKVLSNLAADEQFISRFVDEAQVAIKLQHVNVAQVFEVGRVGNEYFLALEYVEGRDLRRILSVLGHRRWRMPVDLALFIARELANGLAYAHRRTATDGSSLNLVHCDISPPNVLVSFEGETKVIDFGIAKSAMRATATDPRLGFGKFGYMAPEQLIRGGVVDYRTDIYAAGVVLFELLTATRLYEAGPQPDYRSLARKVARGEFPLPSHVDRQLAPYDELVATALRPRPEDRFQSAAELRDAIQQCLVAVNPTISTDQLGAYMRDLFADEMAAQRELHERIASAHLADFQEQFHTQTISTVSFALAQLPLQPPDATGPVVRHVAAQALGGPGEFGPPSPPGAAGAAMPPMPPSGGPGRTTGPSAAVGRVTVAARRRAAQHGARADEHGGADARRHVRRHAPGDRLDHDRRRRRDHRRWHVVRAHEGAPAPPDRDRGGHRVRRDRAVHRMGARDRRQPRAGARARAGRRTRAAPAVQDHGRADPGPAGALRLRRPRRGDRDEPRRSARRQARDRSRVGPPCAGARCRASPTAPRRAAGAGRARSAADPRAAGPEVPAGPPRVRCLQGKVWLPAGEGVGRISPCSSSTPARTMRGVATQPAGSTSSACTCGSEPSSAESLACAAIFVQRNPHETLAALTISR